MFRSVAALLAETQVRTFWPDLLGTIVGFFALCCLQVLWAKIRRKEHKRPGPDFLVDLNYWVLVPVFRILSRFVTLAAIVGLFLLVGKRITPELMHGFGPVARQPKALMLVELFVLTDLASYWSHRLCHTVPWLWRLHAIHHSPTEVKWWSTGRLHPLNDVVTYTCNVVPIVALGFPLDALAPAVPLFSTWAIYLHSESNAALGPLRAIVTSPRFHRWHHTRALEGGNRNFSGVLAIWDRIFGTYYMPKDRLPERFGLDDDDMPKDFLGQLAYPWRSVNTSQSPEEHAASASASRAASLRSVVR